MDIFSFEAIPAVVRPFMIYILKKARGLINILPRAYYFHSEGKQYACSCVMSLSQYTERTR